MSAAPRDAALLLTFGAEVLWYPVGWTAGYLVLLTLVAVISGGVVIMAILLIVLHCRRLRVRTKGLGDKVTEAAENFTEQEIWPGHEAGEGDMAASELKVSTVEKSALLRIIIFNLIKTHVI